KPRRSRRPSGQYASLGDEAVGIRITLFALDPSRFSDFIRQSVWEWLWYYVDHGPAFGEAVRVVKGGAGRATCVATPGVGVTEISGSKQVRLGRLSRPRDPQFVSSMRDYLETSSAWELKALLTALSQCPSADVARPLTGVCRRWWIGSFLDHAERTLGSEGPDYIFLASLFQRFLQGHDCGKALPRDDRVTAPRLPGTAQEDPDLRSGV